MVYIPFECFKTKRSFSQFFCEMSKFGSEYEIFFWIKIKEKVDKQIQSIPIGWCFQLLRFFHSVNLNINQEKEFFFGWIRMSTNTGMLRP